MHAVDICGEIAVLQQRLGRSPSGVVTIATAESATGGRIADHLTGVPGASAYFLGGVVAYSNEAKVALLGVNHETLSTVGAVSAEVAMQMAEGARRAYHADVAVSDTGIAGPGGATRDKPVGLFYIGLATPDGCIVSDVHFNGTREANRTAVTVAALTLLRDYLVQCCDVRGAK